MEPESSWISLIVAWLPFALILIFAIFFIRRGASLQKATVDLATENSQAARENTEALKETAALLKEISAKLDGLERK